MAGGMLVGGAGSLEVIGLTLKNISKSGIIYAQSGGGKPHQKVARVGAEQCTIASALRLQIAQRYVASVKLSGSGTPTTEATASSLVAARRAVAP